MSKAASLPRYVIGLDIGTTSTIALLLELPGRIVAVGMGAGCRGRA